MKALLPSALCAAVAWCAMTAHAARQHETHLTAQIAAVKARTDYAAAQAAYAASVAELGDRVIDLPEDANAWYTSVFTHEQPSRRERQILDWFESDPQLQRLKKQTHFNHYTPASSIYSRYANLTGGGLPVVVLQDALGNVVYKASGEQLPPAPWPLVRGMIDCIRAHCPHCPRPKPKPTPKPEPEPDDVPDDKPVIPDIIGPNEETPVGRDDTLAVTAAVFVLSLAAGFAIAARSGKSFV
ncbi:MAG TPA: hypothetical protein PK867_23945 [Pirellulales bacterium]|nr:hypothetical protein [Pirellulales bacterium]